ncbi:PSP1 C-terminal [Penicillium brevicompactum]|uniref:PSP1 C-terminal n=1 Tax=Penicillium brevicompactum TaxID=5074 RepID=UPI002540BEAA|nr:PSP1 C-terminal [Penicillium brevicompactum]KAJ5326597.1 PSP1 C-terminal [Penicillium brevicompactum]
MSAPSNKPISMAPSSTPPAAATASAILEKTNPGVRRSTPDSEALASSDDDGDHVAQAHNIIPPSSKPPARRTSWLNEVPISAQRKHSLSGGHLVSAPSNPTSPSSDQAPWATTTSPNLAASFNWNQAGGSTFPWGTGTGIWNTESRKEPPSRLSEMVPSPTMTNPPLVSGMQDEMLSPITRTISGESNIPFSIPLHPTPKTYRSQSYSVGQMDPEFLGLVAGKPGAGGQYPSGRPRGPGQISAVQPRASRPSMLGELGHDPAMLGRVREDEDGDDSLNSSESDLNYSASQARQIEQLARENALLRQAAAAGQMDHRYRERAGSAASIGGGVHSLHRIQGGVPEEDPGAEDLGGLRDIAGYNNMRGMSSRRFSEHSPNPEHFAQFASPIENRALENVRKAHWQTSLGFGGMPDIPQSRRHSFADIPMRHGSIGSVDPLSATTPRAGDIDRDDGYGNISDYQNASFYPREQTLRGDGSSGIPSSLSQYAMSSGYGRPPSTLSHVHQNQLLYIVAFKCSRADVFYIQEDTGLQVKQGDLVIVEADRGTDLGTVIHSNISLQQARELKLHYAEEHYKTLMMYSRHGQLEGSALTNPNAGSNTRGATGGMGPHGPHGGQEPSSELKPKLIKRLAQKHEVMTLHDKEGNEAKAKRVCQQKVVEHRLNMEILDAEFQMDWKKLTFYYFADSYINFNSLVTDLFKIYKTRIWMSAINPASFVTPPTAGLPGPGGVSNPLYNQDTERRHHETRPYGGSRDGIDAGRDLTNPVGMLRTTYGDAYQPFGQPARQTEGTQPDVFGGQSPSNFGPGESFEYPSGIGSNGAARMHQAQGEWFSRFQGLSLNS